MQAWIRQSAAGRSLFGAALFFALALRILVPIGFMPVANGDGITISICSGDADAPAHKLPLGKHQTAAAPCTFAIGLGGGLLAAASVAFTVAPLLVTINPGAVGYDRIVATPAALPPPPTGPPLFG